MNPPPRVGDVVRVRIPGKFPGSIGVVLKVAGEGAGDAVVTVAVGWRRPGRDVRVGDLLGVISRVPPFDLRRPAEYASARLRAAEARYRSALDARRVRRVPGPNDDGPDGGGEPLSGVA